MCARASLGALSGEHLPLWGGVVTTPLPAEADDAGGLEEREKEQKKRAATIISAMSSAVCFPLIRLVGWLFFWTFGKLFGRLDVQQTHTGMLRTAQQVGHSLSLRV